MGKLCKARRCRGGKAEEEEGGGAGGGGARRKRRRRSREQKQEQEKWLGLGPVHNANETFLSLTPAS